MQRSRRKARFAHSCCLAGQCPSGAYPLFPSLALPCRGRSSGHGCCRCPPLCARCAKRAGLTGIFLHAASAGLPRGSTISAGCAPTPLACTCVAPTVGLPFPILLFLASGFNPWRTLRHRWARSHCATSCATGTGDRGATGARGHCSFMRETRQR